MALSTLSALLSEVLSPGSTTSHPSAPGSPKILALPVELKLGILKNLPAHEIQKVRQVSKHFADLVDSNGRLIGNEIKSREITRLQDHVAHHYNFDTENVSLIDAMARWFGHHGVYGGDALSTARTDEIHDGFAAAYYMRRHATTLNELSVVGLPASMRLPKFSALELLLVAGFGLHDLLSADDMALVDRKTAADIFKHGMAGQQVPYHGGMLPQQTLGLTDADFADFFDGIAKGKLAHCKTRSIRNDCAKLMQFRTLSPRWELQAFQFLRNERYHSGWISYVGRLISIVFNRPVPQVLRQRVEGLVSTAEVARVLGVLDLPTTTTAGQSCVSYWVRSEPAYRDFARFVLDQNISGGVEAAMERDPLKTAALFEELFID